MRISISPKNDNVNFEPVEIDSIDTFVDYATKFNYSTGTFKDNYRKKSNFIQAEAIALDVDNDDDGENYTIEDAALKFKDYRHIIMPSKSHQKEKNGKIADRFRIILFLDKPITNAKDFTATWTELHKFYPGADKACKDASRFYYPSSDFYSVSEGGLNWPVTEYVEPVFDTDVNIPDAGERGQLSRETLNFLTYGAPAGKRNIRLFKAAKDMQEQGFTIEEVKSRVSAMISTTGNWGSNYLNTKDIEAIENAFKEDPKYPARENQFVKQGVFKFQTIEQMANEAGEIDWLVQDLLSTAGFSLIVGPPKAGKSTLVRQLVKAVAQGGEFLNRKVKKGKVVYLTFEEQPAILKKQFEAVGIKPSDDIIIHTGAVFDGRALEDLEDALYEFEPELVILDTLFDISQLEDINNYKAVKDALSRIRAIARNTNAHILGVHHSNKIGGFMGSQAIFGAVDTMIKFVQQKDRRFLFSSGKHGDHYNDHEIVFDAKTQSYSLGAATKRKPDKL